MTQAHNTFGFGTLELTCISSTSTDDNSGFINKLQHKSTKTAATPFGAKTQQKSATFYMKTDTIVPLGTKAEMNLDDYRIMERPFEIPSEDETAPQVVMLKWISLP